MQFNVERCIWGDTADFVGIFKNVNLKMCAINFDNFGIHPRELSSGKHTTPTQKKRKMKSASTPLQASKQSRTGKLPEGILQDWIPGCLESHHRPSRHDWFIVCGRTCLINIEGGILPSDNCYSKHGPNILYILIFKKQFHIREYWFWHWDIRKGTKPPARKGDVFSSIFLDENAKKEDLRMASLSLV